MPIPPGTRDRRVLWIRPDYISAASVGDLFNEGRLVLGLSHLCDVSVERIAHQSEAEQRHDETAEPEYQLSGENRRQKKNGVE